jgi:hypothetical protein
VTNAQFSNPKPYGGESFVRHGFKIWINVAHPDLSKPFFSSLLAALTTQQSVLGQEHPHTNLTRAKLASIELHLGHAKEAAALAAEALQAHEEKLGRSHSWTIDSALTTIEALEALGRVDEANVIRARFRAT